MILAHRRYVPCSGDVEASRIVADMVGHWNILGFIGMTAWGDVLLKTERLALEAEMTRKVLQARTLRRAAPDGRWPGAVPGIETSRCPDATWTYRVAPDGSTMALALNKEPPIGAAPEYRASKRPRT